MKKEGKFAIFNFEAQDTKLIDELSVYLDNNAEEIFNFFELDICQETIKLQINIIPNKQSFDECYNKDHNLPQGQIVKDWVIGYYNNKNNKIVYLSLTDYKNTAHAELLQDYDKALDYYKKTIVHEFVHYANALYCHKNSCGHTIKYLSEGLASYLSQQRKDKKIEFCYTLEDILSHKKPCYDGWHLITKYLVENYPKNFVLDLIKDRYKSEDFLKKELYPKVKNKYSSKVNIDMR